jgi:PAS domain S-box-containing protein
MVKPTRKDSAVAAASVEPSRESPTRRPSPANEAEVAGLMAELEALRDQLQTQDMALAEAHRIIEESRSRYSDLFDFAPVSYVTLDARGIIRNLNLTASALLGLARQHAIGSPFASLVRPEHQSRFWDHMARCRSESLRLSTDLELKLRMRDGTLPVQLITAPPLRSGASDEFRTAVLDMSDRQLAEERRIELVRELARREEAESSNRAKDEFFSHLAHELRTPLNAVHGWTHLLAGGRLSPADAAHAVDVIWRNVQAQVGLINQMLDVSRIIRGALELRVREVNLAELVRTGIEAFGPPAEERGVRLESRIDPSAPSIDGDADRLYQVITQLISNAVKFSPRGGVVTVGLDRGVWTVEGTAAECARLVVSDTGVGIPRDDLPHVFEPFRRTPGTEHVQGGLGLGLTIVRRLVELHGGSVRARSDGPGRGAEFIVELPMHQPGAVDHESSHEPARPAGGPLRLAGIRVLVVDDDAEACELVRRMLEPLGAGVTTVRSAAEAFERTRTLRPDILISDLAMPEEDGVSLIRRIRALPADQGGDTPAIAVTAYAGVGDEDRVVWAGFQSFVAKPVEARTLAGLVDSLTALNRKPAEN